MIYIACVILGFLLAVLLSSSQELISSIVKTYKDRRYNKLKNGVPKRVVQLRNFSDLRKYKEYPLYINGEVLEYTKGAWWGDVITYMRYFNASGSLYVTDKVIPTFKDIKGIRRHRKVLGVSDDPSRFGSVSVVSAIIEVY